MHRCEFCNASFHPRPQVKRPRACGACQEKRQRANEKAWHDANKADFDHRYHKDKKLERMKRLRDMAKTLCQWLEVGKTFLKQNIELSSAEEFLYQFLTTMGIRQANKFCPL